MGDLTKNLSRSEFACQCGCGFDTVDIALAPAIQAAADHFVETCDAKRAIVTITSGCRCVLHNEAEGGDPGSFHIDARAADHVIELELHGGQRLLVSEDELADYYEDRQPAITGVGRYPSGRVHADTGAGSKRPYYWDNR